MALKKLRKAWLWILGEHENVGKTPTYSGYLERVTEFKDAQVIRINQNGEEGFLLGSWINPATRKWDGSYEIILWDGRITYLFPTRFRYKGFTRGEQRSRMKIKEAKVKDEEKVN